MAFLKYRGSAVPTVAWTVDAAANAALSNIDIDTNFYSLNAQKLDVAGGTVTGSLIVDGNLTVNGTTTTVNSTTITVDDKNIELGSVAVPTDVLADGGGITLKGTTDKTFNWVDATDAWTSSEHIAVAAGKTLRVSGSTSGVAIVTTAAAAGTPTLTLPTTTGTLALTSQLPTVNDASLTLSIGPAGATNTSVTIGTGTGFTANDITNTTYDIKVGPALTALVTSMTGAGTGFLRKNGADTYEIDANVYSLSSHVHYIGTTTVQGSSANQAVTGITSITGGIGNTNLSLVTSDTATASTASGILTLSTGATSGLTSASGVLTVKTGNSSTWSGALSIYTGTATGANNSGAVTISTGAPGATGASGAVTIESGAGGSTSGASGAVIVMSGATTSGSSGGVWLQSGDVTTGTSGNVTVFPGDSNSASGSLLNIYGSTNISTTSGTGGFVNITGGASNSATTSAFGGHVYIVGGPASSAAAIAKTGGSVIIDGGGIGANGTRTFGTVYIGNRADSTTYGTTAIVVGHSANTTTINGTVKLPTVGTSGLVRLNATGTLSADTTSFLSGTVPIANGGTNITTYAAGDILYASATNVLSKLVKGTDGQVLKLASGFPAWGTDIDTNWYPTAFAWTAGTTAGPTGSLTGTGMSAVSYAAIPAAGAAASGIITTGTQTIAGAKTFNDNIILGDATTDTVKINGNLGVGIDANAIVGAYIWPSALTGTAQYGTISYVTSTSASTLKTVAITARANTAAAAYTTTSLIHLEVQNATKGAGSTITSQLGLYIPDLTVGTNNYGIYSAISSAAGKWNIYAAGTAPNYFEGNITLGSGTTSQEFRIDADGAAASGAYMTLYKDGTRTHIIGHESSVVGGASVLSNLVNWAAAGIDSYKWNFNSTTPAMTLTSAGALTAASVNGIIGFGGATSAVSGTAFAGTSDYVSRSDHVHVLPAATTTVRGGIELFSDTAQTTAANAVSTTASRSYGLQVNADGQGVINVPWTDTVYTHPTYTYSAPTADSVTTLASIPLITTLTQTNGHVTGGTMRKLVAGTNVTITPAADGNITIASTNTTYTASTGLTLTTTTFSVNYGTTSTTACVGNDSRLSDARTPLSHVHGNITNAGAIGTTTGLPIITTTSGVLTTGSFGTAAATFCQGNDSRLSDARTPLSHVHGNITNAGAIGTTASLPIITTTSGVLTTGSFGTTAGTFCQGNDSRLTTTTNLSGGTVAATTITASSTIVGSTTVKANSGLISGVDSTSGAGYLNLNGTSGYLNIYPSTYGTGSNYNSGASHVFAVSGVTKFTISTAGDVTATGNITAYSDARLKTDLEVIPNAVSKVQQLTGYTYTRTDSGERQTGVIAQDLIKVLPEAVNDSGEYMSVAYGNVVGLLVEAIKELKAEIEVLKNK